MKRILPLVAVLFASCTADPRIGPDPIDASIEDASSSSSSASSSSSSSASSSSSSASSSSGNVAGDGSGTRLKRYVYTSGDGLVSERGNPFYDTVLGTDCTPTNTVAGVRCIPSPAGVAWFVDAQCTTPAAYVLKSCPPPTYGCKYNALMCADQGAATCYSVDPMPLTKIYSVANGTCQDVSSGLNAYTVYAIGPEIDYSKFATMTLEHE